jgi:hypothetical protein
MEILVEIRSRLLFYVHYFYSKFTGNYVAHHGIQRSGTNYLNIVLKNAGVNVINKYDPKRSDPRHKHCRWFQDKESIYLDLKYSNNLDVRSLDELNKICGYKANTKHIVIYRTPVHWLNGIYKWGVRSKWIDENICETKVFDFLSKAFREWCLYYKFWFEMQDRFPEKILVLSHEDLLSKEEGLMIRLEGFLGISDSLDTEVSKVPKSNKGFASKDKNIEHVSKKVISDNLGLLSSQMKEVVKVSL